MESYKKLQNIYKRINNMEGAIHMLHWDFATYMPKGSIDSRSEQLAILQSTVHEMVISSEISDLLDQSEDNVDKLADSDRRNLSLMRHKWLHANAVDTELVEKLSILGTKCESKWRVAREEDDFASYEPLQQDVLDIVREIATVKSEIFKCSKYDALLDQYDAERRSSEIDKIFAELGKFLPDFISTVTDYQSTLEDPVFPEGKFEIEKQKALGINLMEIIGFDFNKGRIDISHHPFCGGTPDDVRITTRYDENDFTSALMGVLHETGHALYEMGLPEKWRGQPIGEPLGMSVHESQSLLMEMQVCRGKNFINFAAPIMKDALASGLDNENWSSDNLYKISSKVKAGFIRVDADEVTYPIHVMIRYDIEKDLINGKINIRDVPEIWNSKMKDMLGIEVTNYKDGCMQDVHWTDGAFGYFPTYTLGAIMAAQFYNSAKKDKDIEYGIKNGDFQPLLRWLRDNIHSKGSEYNSNDLVENVTGKPLDVSFFIEHLKNRFLS